MQHFDAPVVHCCGHIGRTWWLWLPHQLYYHHQEQHNYDSRLFPRIGNGVLRTKVTSASKMSALLQLYISNSVNLHLLLCSRCGLFGGDGTVVTSSRMRMCHWKGKVFFCRAGIPDIPTPWTEVWVASLQVEQGSWQLAVTDMHKLHTLSSKTNHSWPCLFTFCQAWND